MFGLRPVFMGGGAPSVPPTLPLLDTLTVQPVVAVGLDLERTAYAGAAFRLHNVNTAGQTDIPFVGGVPDSEAGVPFLAGSYGTMATWYNQAVSPTGSPAQTADGTRPLIYDSGTPSSYKGSLGFYLGGARYLTMAVTLGTTSQFMLCTVIDTTDVTAYGGLITYRATGAPNDDAAGCFYLQSADHVLNVAFAGAPAQDTSVAYGKHVLSAWYDGTVLNLAVDGGPVFTTAVAGTVGSTGTLTIGARGDGSNPFGAGSGGSMYAALLSPTYNASDRGKMEVYFKTKYGTL